MAALALLTLVSPLAIAQQPRVASISRPAPVQPPTLRLADASLLALGDMRVEVDVEGGLAVTNVTMRFDNGNDRAVEGDLYVPMPTDATVSGYALDIAGRMVDGVAVERTAARKAFDAEVRKGIDPGLVELTRGNVFHTRVFPVPARGSRTIRLTYVSSLTGGGSSQRLSVPLTLTRATSLTVTVKASNAAKVITSPVPLRFGSDRFSGEGKVDFSGALVVDVPRDANVPTVTKAADGQVYVTLDAGLTAATGQAIEPARVRVVWDASKSRAGGEIARERDAVIAWLDRTASVKEVELAPFANALLPAQRFAWPRNRDALKRAIDGQVYDGGTQLGVLSELDGWPEATVVVSDGLSTFGTAWPSKLPAPMWTLSASTVVDAPVLRRLAGAAGGGFVNAAERPAAEAAAELGRPGLRLSKLEVSGLADVWPAAPAPVHSATQIVGRLNGQDARVTATFSQGGQVIATRSWKVSGQSARESELGRAHWAQVKLGELLARPDTPRAALIDHGKAYGLVTPHTSLLVLETLDQYVTHDVRPPATWPEMRQKWDEAVLTQKRADDRKQQSVLENVLALWQARVEWWDKTFSYPKNFKYGAKSEKKDAESAMEDAAVEREEVEELAARADSVARPSPAAKMSVSKKRKAKNGGSANSRSVDAAIALKAWEPDTPYLRALKGAPIDARLATYLKERDSWGGAPGFYLDCADFFRRDGEGAVALRVLSNLAELKLDDPALMRVMAHRLAQLEELDLAIMTFQAVLALRPEEPQSYRDLALVLERRAATRGVARAAMKADLYEALALLAKVVMGEWDRFAEIQVIALTEFNHAWTKAKRFGGKQTWLDPRLIKALDMDVRIAMSWDADLTDMDLHVIEPSTEKAYYGHNRTTIGGLVTRDFTRGYGPEVYALKKAMNGTYKVQTKFFGSSAAKLQGAVTLQVDVFTNYGRKNEQRKAMTLRLTERKETFTVGEIEL